MKKKISKILAVILSILMLFSAFPVSAALTEGSKYSYSETHIDAYYSTGDWYTADGHMHNNSGQVTLRNLKSTGEPLYCIQIYEGCTGADATARDIKSTNLWNYELSNVAQEGFKRVSIYGYPNYTYGFSARDAQLATQCLIWEFETGIRQGYTAATNYLSRQIFENYPGAQSCYLKILEACADHQNRPSFSNTTVTLKGLGSSNSITITDKYGVLSQYKVISNNDRIKTSVSGNNLTIYATGSGSLSGRLVFTKKNTDINSAFALTGANQTLFYGTIADPVTAPLNIELSYGILQIKKTSEDGIISNIEFNIKGNSIDKNVKTGSNGTVSITELPEGTYTVTEITAGKYAPQKSKTAKVTAGETATVTFNNTLVKGRIEIQKQGEILSTVSQNEDGSFTPIYEYTYLPNAEYSVYAAENIKSGTISIAEGTLVDTLITDTKGSAVTKELYLNDNGTAKYKVIETKAPEGYVLDATEHIVTLTMKQAGIDVTENLKLTDARQKVSLSFNKILEQDKLFHIGNNGEINNVIFGVFAAEDIKAADGSVIPTDALIEKINVSDSENHSYILNTDLPFGSYYIQEIETDEHYILSDTKYPFTFSYTNQDEGTVNIQLNDENTLYNSLMRGSVSGLKIDDDGNALEGALIGLFSADETDFTDENALMVSTSDDNGVFSFTNIPFGKYVIKELVAPEKYLLDENAYPIEISENEQVITLEIIDTLKRGSIHGLKVDNRGNVLEGAVIGLFASDTVTFTKDTALMIDTSDKNGEFSFSDIPVGNYIVKELEAPEGYIIDDKNHEINLTENEQIIEIKIVNTLKIGRLDLWKVEKTSPKTGTGNFITIISFFVAAVFACIFTLIKRRKTA